MEEKVESISENKIQDNIIADGVLASEPSVSIEDGKSGETSQDGTEEGQEDAANRESQEEPQDEGETNEDTPEKETKAVYEKEDWQSKVDTFLTEYPVAKNFVSMIGEEISGDEKLRFDDNCLEKALARVFDKVYAPPEAIAADGEFLEKYIYTSETVRNTVVEKYLEELEKSRPPKAISSRGKITLAPPDRPKSIAEAGAVIRSMLNNRRI